jgi:hypothetical protein
VASVSTPSTKRRITESRIKRNTSTLQAKEALVS